MPNGLFQVKVPKFHGFFQLQSSPAHIGTEVFLYGDLGVRVYHGAGLVADLAVYIYETGHYGRFGFFS